MAIHDNAAAGRFELAEQGFVAFADYRRNANELIIDYVESPPPLRGAGTAGRLMEGIAQIASAQGLKITPICGYAARWLRTHSEHSALSAPRREDQTAGR